MQRVPRRCCLRLRAPTQATPERALQNGGRALSLPQTEVRRSSEGCCWAALAERAGRRRSQLGWDFLPPPQDNKQPPAGTELSAAAWARGAAMGSVLSSDSGKSAPSSATPRALERKGDPELPVTSFDCSVCLEVLHQPVRTRCGHVFCRSCIATSLKNNKWTCPYCRAYLPSEGVPATDVAKRMKSEYQNCTECDTLVCLSEMRAHIRTCQKYIDKYGPLQELVETATRCVCPFCQRELDEDSLLDHCITHHRSERRPVFCPLCRLVPNENANSFNGSLIRHLQVSHTLFYDDFIDFNIIEEALIRRVLDRSLLEYVNHSSTT